MADDAGSEKADKTEIEQPGDTTQHDMLFFDDEIEPSQVAPCGSADDANAAPSKIKERKQRKRIRKDTGPRFPIRYIKPQMRLLGCKKVTGTVPHMIAGILGCFCDEIMQIANEAATAEVRLKKHKQGQTPRLTPHHMNYVKKHPDFKALLADVHFRNVWQSSSHMGAEGEGQPSADNQLACEKRARKKVKLKGTFLQRQRDGQTSAASVFFKHSSKEAEGSTDDEPLQIPPRPTAVSRPSTPSTSSGTPGRAVAASKTVTRTAVPITTNDAVNMQGVFSSAMASKPRVDPHVRANFPDVDRFIAQQKKAYVASRGATPPPAPAAKPPAAATPPPESSGPTGRLKRLRTKQPEPVQPPEQSGPVS